MLTRESFREALTTLIRRATDEGIGSALIALRRTLDEPEWRPSDPEDCEIVAAMRRTAIQRSIMDHQPRGLEALEAVAPLTLNCAERAQAAAWIAVAAGVAQELRR